LEASIPSSPVAVVGTITLLVAYAVAAAAAMCGIVGNARHNSRLVRASVQGLYAFGGLVAFASGLLVYAFVTHDYTIKYVALTSDTTMTTAYKITAFWGALDGSLLFWVLVLAIFSAIAVATNVRRHRDMIGYVVGTILVVQLFFLSLLIFDKHPFTTYLTPPPTDGQGLNPLLQNYWMVIHPPSLYTGFVAATIPFAFAIGALASGRLDDLWLGSVRVWSLICFFFLSFGLILGGRWAYEELGWGGYWAWDPVENAGFLPWFTITAFLHTAALQEQRGIMKVWNLVLVIITFFLTIFGTFLTRSGVVQSVHAFGEDPALALQFIVFMIFILVASLGLVFHRLPRLRQDGGFESFVSREFAFLLNNWILLASCGVVAFLTMLPTITEHLWGERLTISIGFFNLWMTPLGLVLLFLAGAAPLLAWRKTTRDRLYAQFLWPTALAVVTVVALALLVPASRKLTPIFDSAIKLPIPLLCFALIAFTIGSVGQEFVRGAAARGRQTGSDPFTSLAGLILIKRRKYGGYVVHLGIALLFLGFTGKAWDSMVDRTIQAPAVLLAEQGQPATAATFKVKGYTFVYQSLSTKSDDNKVAVTAKVAVYQGKELLEVLEPARWNFRKGSEPTSEVAIHEQLDEDVYLVLTGYDAETNLANFRVFVNPLINWVWIGFLVLAFGTFICLIPQSAVDAVTRKPARTALGKAAELGVLLLVIGSLVGASIQIAHADVPAAVRVAQAGGDRPVEHEDDIVRGMGHSDDSGWAHRYRPDSPLASELMHNLVCLCGGCKRETLFDCKCGYAAQKRKQVLDMLAAYDLTTEKGRVSARSAVIAEFIREYGGEHVLATPRSKATWIVPYLAVAGGLILLFVVGRSLVRRGSDSHKPVAPGADKPVEDEKYADKLDDELRDVDE